MTDVLEAVAPPTSGLRHKFLTLEVVKGQKDQGDHKLTFRGSTGAVDRDGDIIVPDGAILDNYLKNPVFLWAHDWHGRLPVGKAEDVRIVPGTGVDFDILFDSGDPFAMDVERKYRGGFLNAVSIGFQPKEWTERRNEEGWVVGYVFTSWELLELSGVPIPANADALQLSYAKWLEQHPVGKAAPTPSEVVDDVLDTAGEGDEKTASESAEAAGDTGAVEDAETRETSPQEPTAGENVEEPVITSVSEGEAFVCQADFDETMTSIYGQMADLRALVETALEKLGAAPADQGGGEGDTEAKRLEAALVQLGLTEDSALDLLDGSGSTDAEAKGSGVANGGSLESLISKVVSGRFDYAAGKAYTLKEGK